MRTIRLATLADAQPILDIYTPIVLNTAISFESTPPSLETMQQRLTQTLAHWPWLVCEHANQIQGYAYASRHRERAAYQWAVDVSVYVHPDCRRQGIGQALYTALFNGLRLQGFYAAYAGIALPNPASVAIHEGLGFIPVGVYHQVGYKLGAWHDVGWWQCTLQPRAENPAEPLSLASVKESPAFAAGLKEQA